MNEQEKLRIDKWLWAIRIFKTRSLATEACKAGKVKINQQSIKPSHIVKVGEVITIQKGPEKKTVKVLGLLESRADAKKAAGYYEDLTPVSDIPRIHSVFSSPDLQRLRGTGRPTKKDRRDIDKLKGK